METTSEDNYVDDYDLIVKTATIQRLFKNNLEIMINYFTEKMHTYDVADKKYTDYQKLVRKIIEIFTPVNRNMKIILKNILELELK